MPHKLSRSTEEARSAAAEYALSQLGYCNEGQLRIIESFVRFSKGTNCIIFISTAKINGLLLGMFFRMKGYIWNMLGGLFCSISIARYYSTLICKSI